MSETLVPVDTTSRSYQVVVGSGILDTLGQRLAEACPCDAVFVVSDSNVAPLYLERVLSSLQQANLKTASTVVAAGETHKTIETYASILAAMAEAQLSRDSVVVALGGGVVGDMAGFAAATYMRGIRVVQVPTTLLAMVDSSVGGKTAIDLACGKNLVGAFLQPSLVLADVTCLSTLTPEVFADGMGEVVKHAVLASPQLFETLCKRPLAQDADPAYLVQVVSQNVAIKRDVVNADEQERGARQTLNLGHTIGHAIEAGGGYLQGHGHCVAAGLCCMARAAEHKGWAKSGLAARIESCTKAQGLPTTTSLDPNTLYSQATHDKKRHGQTMNIVVPTDIGAVELRTVTLDELRSLIESSLSGTEES